MRLTHGLPASGGRQRAAKRDATPTVLTIGNFDGVHLGHQALLGQLVARARRLAMPATVLTFEPQPREYFAALRHQDPPRRVSSLREKIALLSDAGVDAVHVCRFNQALAQMPAEEFIQRLLVGGMGMRHLVIGDDFRFGAGRAGDFNLLGEMGEKLGYGITAMPTLLSDAQRVSSSAVRDALAKADLGLAEQLLGRPYALCGRVVQGRKLGRELGFPTANIQLRRNTLPLTGIFAVTVTGAGLQDYPGAASLGVRPTLGHGLAPCCEVHLPDYSGNLYGQHLTLTFRHKLRDEAKYDSFEDLKQAIALDVARTKELLSHG